MSDKVPFAKISSNHMILEKLPLSQVQTPIQTTSQIPHLQIYILSRFDRLSLINRGCIPFILFQHTDLWLSSERGLFSCAKWWHEIHWEYWFYGNWDVLIRKKKNIESTILHGGILSNQHFIYTSIGWNWNWVHGNFVSSQCIHVTIIEILEES